jgi:hypothetical protein
MDFLKEEGHVPKTDDDGEETVITSIETILNNEKDFKLNLSRWLAATKAALTTLVQMQHCGGL